MSYRPLPYEFVVFNTSAPNAWALRPARLRSPVDLENEGELAAVVGHEIVHAVAWHGAQAIQRDMLTSLAMIGVAIIAQDLSYLN